MSSPHQFLYKSLLILKFLKHYIRLIYYDSRQIWATIIKGPPKPIGQPAFWKESLVEQWEKCIVQTWGLGFVCAIT